jgi:Na+/phosphate symporter
MELSSFLHHTCTRVERNKIMQEVREKAPEKKKKKEGKKKAQLEKTVQVCIKNNININTTKKQHQQQNQLPMSNKEEERRKKKKKMWKSKRERNNRPNCSLSTALLHLDGKVDKNFFFSFAARNLGET